MAWSRSPLICLFLLVVIFAPAVAAETHDSPDWQNIRPILEKRCFNCHSRTGAAKGLRLDSYATTILGSENGAVVVAGDPERSEMIRRLRGQSTPRMPFLSSPLPETEIALITRWIAAGLANAQGAQ